MADKIGFTKDQLHDIYDQVTSQPGSGSRNEVSSDTNLGASSGPTASLALGSDAVPTRGADIGSGKDASMNSALGTRNEVATAPDAAPGTAVVTDSAVLSRNGMAAVPDPAQRNDATTASALGSPNEATSSSDPPSREKPAADAAAAHRTNIVAATALSSHDDDSRRDSDVGPRNESTPEHHHHHQEPQATKTPATASSSSANANGISSSHAPHLDEPTPRRQSLATSPYRGNIDTTVSPPSPSKKWSFSMGDFGLKFPKQPSNATTQELNKDGSVSMQGGQGPVARGIGSISSSVKRGSVDATVSPRDPAKRWSLGHGDFGLKVPRQGSNAVAQELDREGRVSVSAQGGAEGPGQQLGRQNARGIGSISSSVRRGSVDVSVSQHDKARKWSLRDADLGLKWPKQASNLH